MNIFNAGKNNGNGLNCTENLLDRDYGLYVEEYFHELLSLERKRTERSRKPFLLMLIDIHKLLGNNGEGEIVKESARVLSSSTRETDIKGWYQYEYIIGIIFTEINGVNKDCLEEKIYNSFCNILDSGQVKMIEISSHFFPEESDEQKPDKPEPDLNLYPDLSRQRSSKKGPLFLKRTMDIIGSIFGIVIFSPLLLIIPILIKLTSQGPVLFRQERLGLLGKTFGFLKFRSMHVNNDERIHKEFVKNLICSDKGNGEEKKNGDKGHVYKIKDDPRITPIGRFLRKTSLDELPQFFNVLRGDMSLVGPRPPIPYELGHYDLWHRRRILEIKPGITGIWQVEGRSSASFDEMVRMDIQYINQWSILLDLKILLKTPLAVLTAKGAY